MNAGMIPSYGAAGVRVLVALIGLSVIGGGVRADEKDAANPPRLVGVAKVDVTPAYPVRLNGFGNRREESEGITQPIFAKALAIGADEEQPLVLITVDNLGIRRPMADEVAARLARQAGIERSRVAIAFSHSHTTPKVKGACDTIFSSPIPPEHQAHIDRYDAELTDALEKVALAALAERRPSRLEWAVGKVGFAKNRRTPGGPVDHDLPMLVVRDAADDAIRAIYVTYACHCVTLSDNKISGDWAGYAQQAIEAKHPGAIALVSIGCGSDSNPDSGVTGANTAAAAGQGAQIAEEVERLLAGTLKPITGQASATLEWIELPLNPPPSRAELEQLAASDAPGAYNATFQLARLDRGEPLLTKLDYPIQTWSMGDSLSMVFLGGEICVDYSLRLKRELDASRVWLHGYSNDFCSYIPSERLLKEGGYGGGWEIVYFALPNTLATGLEEKIIAEVHRQVPAGLRRPEQTRQSSRHALPPKTSLATIKTKAGMVVELMAAEPLVADPVAIDFGPDGRLWVADMTDYTRFADETFEQTGTVRMLTDRDGDGRYDGSTVFAEGLRFPTDVKAWRRGVIVCDAPDVLYLEDTDGDGRADVRKVLLSGFETHNAQARVNSLRWGLDSWLYGSCGLFGGTIRSHTGTELKLGARDFRFRPETGEIEAATGRTQQGRARDDWGNWFGCENGPLVKHYPLEDRYLARNPHIAPPATEVFVPAGADPNQLFPIGEPTLYKLSGPPGRPTSSCGLGVYQDELLGAEFANNTFTAEPVNNLVHRRVLSAAGATFRGDRAADEQASEFLASTDPWFRPVQIRTGPDGCLWVVDMHRAVIEHPKFIPEESLRELAVMGGRNEGRIYRVRPRDVEPRPPVRIDTLDAAGLARAMDSPNGPVRDMAHERLVELGKDAHAAAPALAALVEKSARPAVRVQALCALEGISALEDATLTAALADAHPAVRRHALRLCESRFADSPELVDAALELVGDGDPQVQLQLAYSLGAMGDPRSAAALARLAWAHHEDPYVLAGVWSSVSAANIANVATAIVRLAADREIPAALLDPTLTLVRKLGGAEGVEQIAATLTDVPQGRSAAAWRLAAAERLRAPESAARAADDAPATAAAPPVNPQRDEVVKRYLSELPASASREHGRELFGKHCAICHVLEGAGQAVGPDLAALTSREPAALVESILDPNRAVDERYQSYTALTVDGLAHAGLLTAETSISFTLLEQEGKARTLLRADVESLENSGKSLMPEGLERELSPSDVADVLAYLTVGRPVRKEFPGNAPAVVAADYDGTFWLQAAQSEIYGGSIMFEQPYQNIGYWHGQDDQVAWKLAGAAGGEYDVHLEWACAGDSAGNAVVIEGCDPPLKFVVASTGTYDRYQTARLGRTTLAAGENRIVVRPDGPLARSNLLDLRRLVLLPAGTSERRVAAGAATPNVADAATGIARLLEGLAVGTPAEYERIPAIWEQAIAAGRRNDAAELRRVLDLSLPRPGAPLADWQAVVIGGGVINGLTQAGSWPQARLAELLAGEPEHAAAWERAIELAAAMADDPQVRSGTRYDALRMLGADRFERSGAALVRYLADANAELQMGAVSGLGDMEAAGATAALIDALLKLAEQNRSLAVEALLRSGERRKALAAAIERGQAPRELLTSEQLEKVLRSR